MRKEEVEIYPDDTNFAVMRHPGRHFPGSLIQGDTLRSLCQLADEACDLAKLGKMQEAYEAMNDLRNKLWSRLQHYQKVLVEHEIPVP